MTKEKKKVEIDVQPLKAGKITCWLKGREPLLLNRMSAKVKGVLIAGGQKKTKAAREQEVKHNPVVEYRNSMSRRSGDGPTRIVFPAPAIKGAIATAALETVGASKAQIGRLVWVVGQAVDVYGVPTIHTAVVRSADMNKTPDIRTRACLPEWCLEVTIQYITPTINERTLMQLLSNGGIVAGIGDFRQEKGKGNYGQFELSTQEDCQHIIDAGGMAAQDEAIERPLPYDDETAELLTWFFDEIEARGKSDQIERMF